MLFFFQAEDGIRDLVRSRGLGDVYKRQALDMANGTPYGLASTLWTSDGTRMHRMARLLKSGIVWVNCWMLRDLRTPFGGMKQSGVGREGGVEALRFFTEAKNVCIKL